MILLYYLFQFINTQNDYDQLLHVQQIQTLDIDFKFKGFSIANIDHKIYLIGGQDSNQEFSDQFYEFNTKNETLKQLNIKGDLFTPRRAHCSIRYGNFIIIFGGVGEDQYFNDLYHFYPEKNLLKKITITNMIVPSLANVQGVLGEDGKVYFFGGFSLKGLTNKILIYDIKKNQFEIPIVFGTLPSPREFFSLSYLKGEIFLFGGYTNTGSLNDFYSFDISQSKWQLIDTMDNERPNRSQKMKLFELNENLIIIGGCNYKLSKCYNKFWEFDTIKKTFTEFYNDKEFNISETQGILIGKYYYAFNNCQFEQNCSEKIYKIEMNFQIKKNICNQNGIWKDNKYCECFYGFYGNKCSYKNDCYFLNCHLNEFCQENENCNSICNQISCSDLPKDISISNNDTQQALCLNDCTSRVNGICQINGLCLCTPKWTQFKKW